MERREFLTGAAVAGTTGAAGLVGYGRYGTPRDDGEPEAEERAAPAEVTPRDEDRAVRHEDAFGTVVDAVAAGADPEGEEPVDDVFEAYAADDTLLSFAPGTYRLPRLRLGGYDHLGVAAAGESRPTFVAPAGSCVDSDPHVEFQAVTDFLLDGVDFDFRRSGAGGAVNVVAAGDATVRNVTSRGSCREQITVFRVDIRDPDGTGLVENVRAENTEAVGWITGAYVGKRHSGELTFRNCELGEFTDNGLYASAPGLRDGGGGAVHSENGTYRNNNVSNLRFGTDGSTSRGDTIVVESAPEIGSVNLRGIRFRRGVDQVVEGCELTFGAAVTDSFGAIVYNADNGGARVADSRVTVHADRIPAVQAIYLDGESESAPTFENLTVDGEASRGYAAAISGRDGTSFRDCTIEQPGDNRDGIRIAYSDDCELVDSRVDVTGYPLILRDSTLRVRNTTFVTPDGERHVDRMDAGPGDFRPETWTE